MSCDLRRIRRIRPAKRRISEQDVQGEKDSRSNFRNKGKVHFKLHPQEGKERKNMKRNIVYIVHVSYYEFGFHDAHHAMAFAQEAMRSNLEEGGLKIRIELKWEEPEEEEEPAEANIEDVIDVDSLNLDGGDTE